MKRNVLPPGVPSRVLLAAGFAASLLFTLLHVASAHGGDVFRSDPARPELSFRYETTDGTHSGVEFDYQTSSHEETFPTTESDAFPRVPTSVETLETQTPDGLRIQVVTTRYRFYPVVEWEVWFENVNDADGPAIPLKSPAAFDLVLEPGDSPTLTTGFGEDPDPSRNYAMTTLPLVPGEPQTFSPREAYPSFGAFPYFVVEGGARSYVAAIGWTGGWRASVTLEASGGVRFTAGQENVDLYLKPGEKIRTPRGTLFCVERGGDVTNLWRDWFRRYIMPREEGEVVLRPKLALDVFYRGELYDKVTASEQIDAIRKLRALGYSPEALWVDAGWYLRPDAKKTGVGYWFGTGDWTPDPSRFPEGFRPVAEELASGSTRGKLTLWFEPERVHRDMLTAELRQYVVPDCELVESYRMNLASPKTVEYLSRVIGDALESNVVGIYRQDSNGAGPGPFLAALESSAPEYAGRRGYAENLYVRGLYEFWRNLKARRPGLVIDNCASGGRRNDLEALRQGAVPLHYSDVGYFDFVEKQHMHDTLNRWFVYYKNIDPHDLGDDGGYDVYKTTIDMAPFSTVRPYVLEKLTESRRSYLDRYLAIRELLVDGDYYLLRGGFTSKDWTIWQFDDSRALNGAGDPVSDAETAAERYLFPSRAASSGRQVGCVLCVRNAENEEDTHRVAPHGIDPLGEYEWTNLETGESSRVSGEVLSQGIEVRLPKRSGAVWRYERVVAGVSASE